MKLKVAMLAAGAVMLWGGGAAAQTRKYLIHFDGSCLGMTLHVTNGLNVEGNSVGCGDTKRAYVGKIGEGDVASMRNVNTKEDLVQLNYVISMRKNTWVLYETLDGKTEQIGNGFWTKRGPTVVVESTPGIPDTPPPATPK